MATEIRIANWKQVQRHFEKLDITKDKNRIKETRKILKDPMLKMRKTARQNLKTLMTTSPVSTGNLYRGLSVGSKFSKRSGYFSVAFGARSWATNSGKSKRSGRYNTKWKNRAAINHFHLVNSGTKKRYHKNFKNVGAVGKRKTTKHKLINPAFRLSGKHTGFADKAILANISYTKNVVPKKLAEMYSKIKTQGT